MKHLLWRFLNISVRVEGRKLLLDSIKRVSKNAIVQGANRLLNPFQKVGSQCVIVGNHLIIFTTLVENLMSEKICKINDRTKKT